MRCDRRHRSFADATSLWSGVLRQRRRNTLSSGEAGLVEPTSRRIPSSMGRDMEIARYGVVGLEAVVALSAFGGGALMVADPQDAMGLPRWMRERLPVVDSWLVPGVALIACNGLLPTAAAVAELRGRTWPRRWGHTAAGVMLLAWPVAETALFGWPVESEPRWLRPGVAAAGVAIGGLSMPLRRAGA